MHVLVTGGAGFVGSTLVEFLLNKNIEITVVDNFDDFYSPEEKRKNIAPFMSNPLFHLIEMDIHDLPDSDIVNNKYYVFIHLASKGGVRLSINHKEIYHHVNVEGTRKVFDFVTKVKIPKVIFASSSSIYGDSKELPWHEKITNLRPISPYANTKLLCEQMGMELSNKHGFSFVALRFFSVIGPKMRPDLAMYSFTKKILENESICLFGDGTSSRDYTYIDDIVNGIYSAIEYNEKHTDIFNLGYGETHSLIEVVKSLEKHLNKTAKIEFSKSIKEEANKTWSDSKKAQQLLNFSPKTDFDTGVRNFCNWFLESKGLYN